MEKVPRALELNGKFDIRTQTVRFQNKQNIYEICFVLSKSVVLVGCCSSHSCLSAYRLFSGTARSSQPVSRFHHVTQLQCTRYILYCQARPSLLSGWIPPALN